MISSNDNEHRATQDRRRMLQNVLAGLWIALLLYGSYVLLTAFVDNQRQQECIAHGYRSCTTIDLTPPR